MRTEDLEHGEGNLPVVGENFERLEDNTMTAAEEAKKQAENVDNHRGMTSVTVAKGFILSRMCFLAFMRSS